MATKHECQLKDTLKNSVLIADQLPRSSWLTKIWQNMVLVSTVHPLCSRFFRSETNVKNEKIRQLNHNHPWVVHPLSKMRLFYEMYLLILYTWALVIKPVDAAYVDRAFYIFAGYNEISIACDVLCWIDIFVTFFTGYTNSKTKFIELRLGKIFWKYVKSPYFICDVLSSIPKTLIFMVTDWENDTFHGIVNLLFFLKFARLVSLYRIVNTVSNYFELSPSPRKMGFRVWFTFTIVLHGCGCLGVALPRSLVTHLNLFPDQTSWIYKHNLHLRHFFVRYVHGLFRVACYFFGQRIYNAYVVTSNVDYVYIIFCNFFGKILFCSIWVIMAMNILKYRQMNIKYHEVMSQLQEYMTLRKLPAKLQYRITEYYKFKYQKKYFKEKMVTDLLSDSLKNEINLHTSKTMIHNVTLFSELDPAMTKKIVSCLELEIYLAGDTIVQSGSFGEAMYFIFTGTVAVYTHSGKEICHLEDGGYFGEISLLMAGQRQISTVIAIEITQIYKLSKRDFERHLIRNPTVFQMLLGKAQRRMKLTMEIEENYKKMLFATEFSKL